jgi:hypothetical protein
MLLSIALALLAPAHASSDIEFKTSGPVLIYVDGAQAQLTSKLKQKSIDLEPGEHEIKVTGVFGKTLFEAEISLPDNTVTQAEWSGRELQVLSTDWRDSSEESEPLQAEAPEEEEEEDVVEVAEEEPEPEVVAEEMVELAESAPLALPVDPAIALAPPPRAPVAGKTLTVQANEGMRVEVVHNGQTLVVTIQDGAFQIEDPSGLQMALTASR